MVDELWSVVSDGKLGARARRPFWAIATVLELYGEAGAVGVDFRAYLSSGCLAGSGRKLHFEWKEFLAASRGLRSRTKRGRAPEGSVHLGPADDDAQRRENLVAIFLSVE